MEDETVRFAAMVVTDDPFAREALCQMLTSAAIDVIPVSGSDEECLDVIERNQPRVVITDLHSSDDASAGTSLVRQVRAVSPTTACLVLVASDPTGMLLRGALLAGAQGCIRKGAVPRQGLAKLVRRLAAGEYIIDPLMAAEPRTRGTRAPETRPAAALSVHERRVLDLLAQGVMPDEIASQLGVSAASAREATRHLAAQVRHELEAHKRPSYRRAGDTHMQEEMAPWPTKNTLA